MTLSKNEIKERRGKIACAIVVGIPLMVLIGYLLFVIIAFKELGESIKRTSKITAERRIKKNLKRDKEVVYREILGQNKKATFTGTEERNDTIFTNALQIKSNDSTSIEYRIESLINWKPLNDIIGIAKLDVSSLGSEKWEFQDKEGIWNPAFRFIDLKKECQIEILISKRRYPRTIAIAKEICGERTKELTVKLNYK